MVKVEICSADSTPLDLDLDFARLSDWFREVLNSDVLLAVEQRSPHSGFRRVMSPLTVGA